MSGLPKIGNAGYKWRSTMALPAAGQSDRGDGGITCSAHKGPLKMLTCNMRFIGPCVTDRQRDRPRAPPCQLEDRKYWRSQFRVKVSMSRGQSTWNVAASIAPRSINKALSLAYKSIQCTHDHMRQLMKKQVITFTFYKVPFDMWLAIANHEELFEFKKNLSSSGKCLSMLNFT